MQFRHAWPEEALPFPSSPPFFQCFSPPEKEKEKRRRKSKKKKKIGENKGDDAGRGWNAGFNSGSWL